MAIQLIRDGQALVSAKTRFGYTIPIYDDGFGPLFILRDSMGIQGIIRAQSWEDAYEIAEDEMFPEADEATWDAIAAECECDPEALMDNEIFQESYGFRPNGRNATDVHGHGIYQKDLNGDYLDALTPALVEQLGISLEITVEAEG